MEITSNVLNLLKHKLYGKTAIQKKKSTLHMTQKCSEVIFSLCLTVQLSRQPRYARMSHEHAEIGPLSPLINPKLAFLS